MMASSHPALVRRALAIVERSDGEPVAIHDLCRAAGVCERTLRNAFHHVYGVSPKQYLIGHGLDEAHDALQHTAADRGAVTHIATECGFFELGRFAAAYRRRFGERPSDTLRAATAQAAA
jgi:transcriptional regulator GlxA family with amidase domain